VDTFLAIASKRDERRYASATIAGDVVERILDAGRVAGSARNRQPWRFVVVESADRVEQLAAAVYEPDNVRGAALVVALVGQGFDLGRCAQNMMLAAWNDGVLSCPNGIADADAAAAAVGLDADEQLGIVLSFGHPARPRNPEARPAADWSARAKRNPLAEIVTRI
jgi:nitroreductase